MKLNKISKGLCLAVAGITSSISYSVFGQDDQERLTEEILVTGSRIIRKDLEAASPVTVLGRAEIEVTSATDVADILKNLPSVSGNMVTTSSTNGGGEGAADITLRALPSTATLVLVNGRRLAPNGNDGETVDINMIPLSSIERIEVLKDGASAIYGSDAIAGVVNIITRRDFEGLELVAGYGEATEGDYPNKEASLTFGSNFDKGNIVVGINWTDKDALPSRNRDISSVSLSPSSAPPWGNHSAPGTDPNNSLTLIDRTNLNPTAADFRPFVGGADNDSYNFSEITDAIMAQERKSIFASGLYNFSDTLSGFFESSAAQTLSSYKSAPTPLFTQFEFPSLVVDADQIYNPFGEDITDARRRLLELGPRISSFDYQNYRLALGLEGIFGDNWRWDAAWNWNETRGNQNNQNIINKTRTQLALGDPAGCEAVAAQGCVPLNIFGGFGAITEDQARWIREEANIGAENSLLSYTFNITGDVLEMPAGALGFAAGLEYREEDIAFRPDGTTSAFQSIGNTNFLPTSGDRDVTEAYAEVLIPIIADAPAVKALDLELAVRYSDYSDFGTTTNPKVGAKWRVNDALMARATFSEGFRAPTLRELYQGAEENFGFFTDPCATATNVGVLPGCTQQSDPNLIQFLAQEGGNTELEAEESESFTIGFVITPLDNLNISIDYFNIETENAIDTNAQFVIDQNALGTSGFETRVTRNTNGDIILINALALNLAAREVTGIDLAVDYSFSSDIGEFLLSSGWAYIEEYLNQADATADFVDEVGIFVDDAASGRGSVPELKGFLSLNWSLEDVTANYRINYVSELDEANFSGGPIVNTMDEWITHDIQFNYTIPDFNTGLTFGVDNLLDEEPPVAQTGFNDNMDARTHSLVGSFWYTRATIKF